MKKIGKNLKKIGKKLEKNWKKLEKNWKKLEKNWKKTRFFRPRSDNQTPKRPRLTPALHLCEEVLEAAGLREADLDLTRVVKSGDN